MGFADRQISALVAMAQVTGTTGVAVMSRGLASVARASAGVYNLTYDAGMTGAGQDSADLITKVTCGGTSPRFATRVYSSATVLQVRTFDDTGSATDADFDVTVERATNHE